MTDTRKETPPLAEPGKRRSGASTGGIAQSADSGIAAAQQRAAERKDEARAEDEAASVAREREEPPDEGAVESIGRSVSDVVTGSDAPGGAKRRPGG